MNKQDEKQLEKILSKVSNRAKKHKVDTSDVIKDEVVNIALKKIIELFGPVSNEQKVDISIKLDGLYGLCKVKQGFRTFIYRKAYVRTVLFLINKVLERDVSLSLKI